MEAVQRSAAVKAPKLAAPFEKPPVAPGVMEGALIRPQCITSDPVKQR